MTTDVKGMGIGEYLAQGDYLIDPRSQSVFQISEMDPDTRLRAARNLARMSTAMIGLAESEAVAHGELAVALHLAHQQPREWMVRTELYRALYPEPAGEVPVPSALSVEISANHLTPRDVVQMHGVPRSA